MGPFFAILGDFDDPIDYGAIQKKQPKWKQHVILGWRVGTNDVTYILFQSPVQYFGPTQEQNN